MDAQEEADDECITERDDAQGAITVEAGKIMGLTPGGGEAPGDEIT